MGSGKSSVGKDLAHQTQLKLIDLDQYIEEKTNQSISEIFANGGEIRFRKLEREALLEVLALEESYILALGGGTPAYYDNLELINQNTTSVYLRMGPAQLKERIETDENRRPLLERIPYEDRVEFIAKHLFERRSFYEQAQLVVDVKTKSIEEISEEIIQHLHLLD